MAGGSAYDTRNPTFALARYNSGGTLDLSFGGGDGRVTTDFTRREDAAYGIVIQPDGKIVAAGDAGLGSGNSRFAVARYNSDGTLDSTFGGDGKVTTQFSVRNDPVAGLTIQADGKIVVCGGVAFDGRNPNFALARYNSDGTLDTTFGADGRVTTDFGRNDDYSLAVVVQADGRLVGGGFSVGSRTSGRGRLALARYDDGTLDITFGGDGKVLTNFTKWDDSVQNLALQPDGKIVAVGAAGFRSANERFALARYNTDGTLDVSLGGDGKVATDLTPGSDSGRDVALQPDGKIVEAGHVSGRGGRFAVARFDSDGGLDVTFAADGKAMTNFTRYNDFAFGLARQADGNLVLAGGAGWGGSNPKIALARYLGS